MINIAVEGESDRAAACAVVKAAHQEVLSVRIAHGTGRLDKKIQKYNIAALNQPDIPWVVFRDSDGACPVTLRNELAGSWTFCSSFQLRIACSMTESWLLADTEHFASFFGLNEQQVAQATHKAPDNLRYAKRVVLQLCTMSTSRSIRSAMVRGNDEIGPLYVQKINEYASTVWDPTVAACSSDSLRRALQRIRKLPV